MIRATGGRRLVVLRPGPLTTVQDLGRPGRAHLGVTRSGAADRSSLRLANRLVGNPESAAALEVTLGGLALRAERDVLVAVTGATCPVAVGGAGAHRDGPVVVRAGQVLELGPADRGVRAYVAVRGGIDVPPVLGSRSTDTLSGLGPPPLREGDVVPVGGAVAGWPWVDVAPVRPPADDVLTLAAVPGPRDDRLEPGELARLAGTTWTVSVDSDRVGVRLEGEPVRTPAREWPSEGTVRGAIQVPPDGRPVLFLADHPVTGGYPVPAVVVGADTDRAAQARPGTRIRFRLLSPPEVSG